MSERRYCPACTPKVREAIKEVSTCRLETNHYERKRADEKIASLESDLARLREIERAAREVETIAEGWDCSEVWEDDGDCIDNKAVEACLRCAVIRTLRTALEKGKEVGR